MNRDYVFTFDSLVHVHIDLPVLYLNSYHFSTSVPTYMGAVETLYFLTPSKLSYFFINLE
jgi:hypothetical protein